MRSKTLCYFPVLALAWTAWAPAQSTLIGPSKTNTLIQVASSAGTAQLSNGQGDIFVGRTNQDGQGSPTISIRRGLVAFDVADNVPAGATITGVTLAMQDENGMNGNQTISLSRMLRDWGQGSSFFNGGIGAPATNGDVTWYYTFYDASNPAASPAWTVPGGQPGVDFSAAVSALALDSTGGSSQTLDWSSMASPAMITDVQVWLDNPAANFGWIMMGNESAGQTAKRFGGQTAATYGETPPALTVQYLSPFIWSGSGGNNGWTTQGNWASGSGTPGNGVAIVLGSSASVSGTVDLGAAAPSVSHLTFDANRAVTIASTATGGGSLTLDNGENPAAVVVSGSGHTIDGNIVITLDSDAWITTGGSGDALAIAGDIVDGAAPHALEKDGPGMLILAGSNTYSGGTTVTGGTLVLEATSAIYDGTNVTVGDASDFGESAYSTASEPSLATAPALATAVPEPGTLALLAAGILIVAFRVKCRVGRAQRVPPTNATELGGTFLSLRRAWFFLVRHALRKLRDVPP